MFGKKAERIAELETIVNTDYATITELRSQLKVSGEKYERVHKQYQDGLKQIANGYSENFQLTNKLRESQENHEELENDYITSQTYLGSLREQHQDLQNRYDLLEALLKQLTVSVKLPVRKTTK